MNRDNHNGHLDETTRYRIVLFIRLGYGDNSVAKIVGCRPPIVKRARKAIREYTGAYATISAQMDLRHNKEWFTRLVDKVIQERISALHPSAEDYRNARRSK